MKTKLSILCLLLLSACGLNSPGGDDEWGDPVDQTPDNYNVPEFVDAHDIHELLGTEPYASDQPNALNGLVVNVELASLTPEEREYTAFAPSTPPQPDHQASCVYCGWPSKPWMKGIPELPCWSFTDLAQGPFHRSMDEFGHSQGDLRSCLIGNFALHIPQIEGYGADLCPSTYPRSPICTPLASQIGHPLIAGRYTDYGLPCIDSKLDTDDVWEFGADDCTLHFFVGTNPAGPQFPNVSNGDDEAVCLANGETYRPEIAALGAPNRNGLFFLNIREMGDLINFIENTLEPIETLLEAIPWWDYSNSQWDYVQNEVSYRWSEMSSTGICSFKSSLQAVDEPGVGCEIVTVAACPKTHFAVLPPFDTSECHTLDAIEGFCGLPFFDFIANESAYVPGQDPLPITQLSKETGYERGYNLHFGNMTDALLADWASGIQLTQTREGIRLDVPADGPYREIGIELLAEFDLLPGDVVQALDHDIDLRPGTLDPRDALLTAISRFANEDGTGGSLGPQVVTVWVLRDGHLVLPTYLFPVLG